MAFISFVWHTSNLFCKFQPLRFLFCAGFSCWGRCFSWDTFLLLYPWLSFQLHLGSLQTLSFVSRLSAFRVSHVSYNPFYSSLSRFISLSFSFVSLIAILMAFDLLFTGLSLTTICSVTWFFSPTSLLGAFSLPCHLSWFHRVCSCVLVSA